MLHAAPINIVIIRELYLTSNAKADLSATEAWSTASSQLRSLLAAAPRYRVYIRRAWTGARHQEAMAQQLESGGQRTRRTKGAVETHPETTSRNIVLLLPVRKYQQQQTDQPTSVGKGAITLYENAYILEQKAVTHF